MSDQRTEKPTQQRLRKAREKGQFPGAKELVGALQFLVIVLIVSRLLPGWFESAQTGFQSFLREAFRPDWNTQDLLNYFRSLVVATFLPVAAAAGIITLLTLSFQLAATNFGVHLGGLAPSFERLNPMGKLKQITSQNIPHALQAVVLLAIVMALTYSIGQTQLPALMALPLTPVRAGIAVIGDSMSRVLWRAMMVLLVFGLAEGFRQRARYEKNLRMTKQEVRQEMKDSDGDPHIKGRIRRLRRALLRRRMMQDVPTATAVIVNPTHYAVAIRYEPQTMASPRVVAKGRNFIAARIRQLAVENSVMIVENPPLARALYGSVEVGGEIPPDFYRAVAEVLAYVYRMTGGHRNI
jgi:flagellar biosynthetic protein FlhB